MGVGITLFFAVLSVDSTAQVSTAKGKTTELAETVGAMAAELDALTGEESGAELKQKIDALAAGTSQLSLQIEALSDTDEAQAQKTEAAEQEIASLKASLEDVRAETAALKARVDTAEARPPAGYDHGFFITAKDRQIVFRLNGFVRPRYALVLTREWTLDANGFIAPTADRDTPDRVISKNGFDIQTGRMATDITLTKYLLLRAELDYGQVADAPVYSLRFENPAATELLGDRSLKPSLRVLDLYGVVTPVDGLSIKAGQFKVVFDKESSFLPTETPFVSGSLLTHRYRVYGDMPLLEEGDPYYRQPVEIQRAARFGRDVGAEVSGHLLSEKLSLSLGVFNGAGLGKENDNRDVLTALRIEGRPLGAISTGIADIGTASSPQLALGVAAAFDLPLHQSAYAPDTRYNSADISVTADAHVKWRGLSVLAAIFYRYADHGGGIFEVDGDTLISKELQSLGGMVQLAYYNAETRLMPAARYSIYSARLDREKDHVHQATIALTYRVIPEHLSLTLEYSGLFPSDTSRSYLAPVSSWVDDRHDISVVAELRF